MSRGHTALIRKVTKVATYTFANTPVPKAVLKYTCSNFDACSRVSLCYLNPVIVTLHSAVHSSLAFHPRFEAILSELKGKNYKNTKNKNKNKKNKKETIKLKLEVNFRLWVFVFKSKFCVHFSTLVAGVLSKSSVTSRPTRQSTCFLFVLSKILTCLYIESFFHADRKSVV